MIQALFDYQREIYLAVAQHLKAFAGDGNWPIQNGSLEADQSECRHHLFGKAVGRR